MAKPTTNYTRYIPLLIKEKLNTINYKRIDNLYVIIDLIYSKNDSFRTKSQREYCFSEIPQVAFRQFLGDNNNVNEDLNYLIDEGYIIRNNHYDVNLGKCKAYKIASEYLSKKVAVTISNKNINKKIGIALRDIRKAKVKNLDFQKSKYYKNFKIDRVGAINYIEKLIRKEIKDLGDEVGFTLSNQAIDNIINCTDNYIWLKSKITSKEAGKQLYSIMHRYMLYTVLINRINDGYLYFKRNETNNRLDTNLTSLPTFLRKFIISENELFNVDIKNSQPFFLSTLLKNDTLIDKNELEFYISLVTSDSKGLYEFLESEKYNFTTEAQREENIKKVKKMIFKIYYSKVTSYPNEKKFFASYFPTIMNFINKKNAVKNNTLAIELQNIESGFILDDLMPKLKSLNIIPYTIHDSFVCTINEVDTIVGIIKESSLNQFGISPALHIENLRVGTKATPEDLKIKDYEESLLEDYNEDDESKTIVHLLKEFRINNPLNKAA